MISDLFSKDSEKIKAEMKRQFDAEMKEMDDMLRQEGYKQGQKEIVINMKNKGLSIEEIINMTGLDYSEVQKFLN